MSITSITQIAPTPPSRMGIELDVNREMSDLKDEIDLFPSLEIKRRFIESWITIYKRGLNLAICNGHHKIEDRYLRCIDGARKLLNETIRDSNKAGGK